MATLEAIKRMLKEIAASYPGRFEMDEDSVKAWAVYLVDIDSELLVNAVRSFISSSTHAFPPSIPEIRKEATQIRRRIAGVPDVWEAWGEVERADENRTVEIETYIVDGEQIQTHYARAFSHQLVWKVAKSLGWPGKFPDPENMVASRAHFRDAYLEALKVGTKDDMQIPQVKEYTQEKQIEAKREMKQLAEGMTK